QYHLIVRTDLYNEVFEGPDASQGEQNNTTTSAGAFPVTSPVLHIGVPQAITLGGGQDRLYQVDVDARRTLKVSLTTMPSDTAAEVYVRYGDIPSGFQYEASSGGGSLADSSAVIPSTRAGTYY